jgi:hypothetical protein
VSRDGSAMKPTTDTLETIAPAALDAITGGGSGGDALRRLAGSEEGRRLLAEYLPGTRPRPPVR